MISLDKCNGSYNVVDDLSIKICFKGTKYVNVKKVNVKRENLKLKYWQNIFYAIVNANSIVQHVNQNKYGIMLNVNVNAKSISQVLCQ